MGDGSGTLSYLTDERGVDDYTLATMEPSIFSAGECTFNTGKAIVSKRHSNIPGGRSNSVQNFVQNSARNSVRKVEHGELTLTFKVEQYEKALDEMTELRTRAEIQSQAGVEPYRLEETKKLLIIAIKRVTALQEELEKMMAKNDST